MFNPSVKNTPRILLVSGDASLNAMLPDNLNAEGYEVLTVMTAEEALVQPIDEFNLIISEIDLPGDIDGFELLERVKEDRLTAGVPLIFCTSRESENDLIKGLNGGADDFVTRPFSLREMMARIRSVLRRHRNMSPIANTRIIEFRTLLLNVDSHGLIIDGEAVSLSPTEFSLLTMLLRSLNKLFRREEIIAAIWPGESVDNPRLVDVNISRLRKKLASYSKNLVNKSGLGYGFMDK